LDRPWRRLSLHQGGSDCRVQIPARSADLISFGGALRSRGGGWALCGGAEAADEHGQKRADVQGLPRPELERIRNIVLQRCRGQLHPSQYPRCDDWPVEGAPDRRLLAIAGEQPLVVRETRPAPEFVFEPGRLTVVFRARKTALLPGLPATPVAAGAGLLVVSVGGRSIEAQVDASRERLGLVGVPVVGAHVSARWWRRASPSSVESGKSGGNRPEILAGRRYR
jgi:hypothetical protein